MTLYNELQLALRKHYPEWLRSSLTFWTTASGKLTSSDDNHDGNIRTQVDPLDALLVGSKKLSGEDEEPRYRVFLDLDVPVVFLPSSTEGNYHLIIDTDLTEEEHDKVMDALVEAKIIQRGFALSGRNESGTTLRLPWVRKGEDKTLKKILTEPDIPF